MRHRWRSVSLLVFLGAWTATACWHTLKPMPEGTRIESPWRELAPEDVRFIADITTADAYGRPILSQAIFDEILHIVANARQFLVLDYFLFNEYRGALPPSSLPPRPLTRELCEALIARKRAMPNLQVLFLTDPVNTAYGADSSPHLSALRSAGIEVVVTEPDVLRDSNFAYSALWRLLVSWWGDEGGPGALPHPLQSDARDVSLRTWLQLLNFKANHRKVLIGDDGAGNLVGLVSSANPHDASSAHSNVAIQLRGPVLHSLLASELAVARFSGWKGRLTGWATQGNAVQEDGLMQSKNPLGGTRVQILTEGAIREVLLARIRMTGAGDAIDMALFYLSERQVIEALLAASRRGVNVRLILDPNKDAFGRTKSGIPNRPVASELAAASEGAIHIRWYRTHGEQFHTKLVAIYSPRSLWFTAGSANLTRRNLNDYNLEANVAVEIPRGMPLAAQVLDYFDTLWSNRAPLGIEYTADFDVYADPAQSHYWLYRIAEATGISMF